MCDVYDRLSWSFLRNGPVFVRLIFRACLLASFGMCACADSPIYYCIHALKIHSISILSYAWCISFCPYAFFAIFISFTFHFRLFFISVCFCLFFFFLSHVMPMKCNNFRRQHKLCCRFVVREFGRQWIEFQFSLKVNSMRTLKKHLFDL